MAVGGGKWIVIVVRPLELEFTVECSTEVDSQLNEVPVL